MQEGTFVGKEDFGLDLLDGSGSEGIFVETAAKGEQPSGASVLATSLESGVVKDFVVGDVGFGIVLRGRGRSGGCFRIGLRFACFYQIDSVGGPSLGVHFRFFDVAKG